MPPRKQAPKPQPQVAGVSPSAVSDFLPQSVESPSWTLAYLQKSLRNIAEIFLLRGFEFTHEAVREWEERFAPLLTEHIRRKPKGPWWYADETYVVLANSDLIGKVRVCLLSFDCHSGP